MKYKVDRINGYKGEANIYLEIFIILTGQTKRISLMNTIKILLISVLVLTVISVRGQDPSVTFFGGANVASMSIEHGNTSTELEDSYGMLYGLNVGALYDYVFKKDRSQELSVESGVIFDSRGYGQNLETEGLQLDNKTTLYYADIPFYLKYKYRFRSRNKIYFAAGPYLGIGLFGNSYVEFQYEGAEPGSNSETISWGDDPIEDHYKRLDYGLTGKVGFQMDSGFNIAASYDYGLPNVSAVETNEQKNRLIRLSLGYTLKFD